MEAQTRQKGGDSRYVIDGGVVRSDCIKIDPDFAQDGRSESHNETESGESAGGAREHVQPFVRVRWGCRKQSGG